MKDKTKLKKRIDVTISQESNAKLEEMSRITGIPKSQIIEKMIQEEDLQEAIAYARYIKMMNRNKWGKIATTHNRYDENKTAGESGQPAEAALDSEQAQEDDSQFWKDIQSIMPICKQKWGITEK